MEYKTSPQKLNGIKMIVDATGAQVSDLADQVGLTYQHVSAICSGSKMCSVPVLQKMAEMLCCTPNDLLGTPSPIRLSEIRIAYLNRQMQAEKTRLAQLVHEADTAAREAALGGEAA